MSTLARNTRASKFAHGVADIPRQRAAQRVARRVADTRTAVSAEDSRKDGHATPRGEAGAEIVATPSYRGTAGPSTYRRCHVEKQSSAHRIPSRLWRRAQCSSMRRATAPGSK